MEFQRKDIQKRIFIATYKELIYIKEILCAIALIGLVVAAYFAYCVYSAMFKPNTAFNNEEAYILQNWTIVNPNCLKDRPFETMPSSIVRALN